MESFGEGWDSKQQKKIWMNEFMANEGNLNTGSNEKK